MTSEQKSADPATAHAIHACGEALGHVVDLLEAGGAEPADVGLALAIVLATHAILHGVTREQLVHVITVTFDSAVKTGAIVATEGN